MKPIFTIHAGEYLVGSHIEQHLLDRKGQKVNVWIPSKDTGVDLLVTDKNNRNTTSLQVKFSKDFLATHGRAEYQQAMEAFGWWTLYRDKIKNSPADYWVFVLHAFHSKSMQYVILKPKDLLKRLTAIHPKANTLQSYLWVSTDQQCWETRGLKKKETDKLVLGGAHPAKNRDFTPYLNNWDVIFSDWS